MNSILTIEYRVPKQSLSLSRKISKQDNNLATTYEGTSKQRGPAMHQYHSECSSDKVLQIVLSPGIQLIFFFCKKQVWRTIVMLCVLPAS